MRIAITGANGQLGKALQATLGREHEIVALGHTELELSRPECMAQLVATGAELLDRFYIARVAWLCGGERNFVRTVLRLAAERDTFGMVADEIGSPTYAPDVAEAVAQLIQLPFYGTYHLVNEGSCSRFAFAAEILRRAGRE